jgi:hypothetical protein
MCFSLEQKKRFIMCVGVESFNLKQERDLEKDYNLLQGVGSYGLKQDHNAM